LIEIREAISLDMDVVYMMGYDVWGGGMPSKEYVTMCNDSNKYKRGRWYVLEDTDTKELLCSLIVYELNPSENVNIRGIGSIATPLHLRHKGYASILIKGVINELEQKYNCDHFFLYSDIEADFYKKLDFIELQPKKQKYRDSICMYYSKQNDIDSINFEIPDYF
jgi:hypothetical protein